MGNACMRGAVVDEFFVALVGSKDIVKPDMVLEMPLSPAMQSAALTEVSLWQTGNEMPDTRFRTEATSSFYRYSSLMVPQLTSEAEAKAIKIFNNYSDVVISVGSPRHDQISSAIHAAAAAGSLELLQIMAKFVLEDERRPEEERQKRLLKLINKHSGGMRGKTPLMLAASLGHANCVKFLVQKGADCLARERMQGLSAIHLATREGHAACIDAMLTTEVEILDPQLARATPSRIINASTTSGFTPLHFAVSFTRHDCLETLLKYSPSLCPGSRGVYGPEIGMHCTRGTTPLHVAAHTNNLRATFFILRHYCHVSTLRAADGTVTPDPRQVCDSLGRSSYQVAMQARSINPRNIDPGLAELLALDADLRSMTQIQMPTFGPPRLSVLAAGVLKVKLLADLELDSDTNKASDTNKDKDEPEGSSMKMLSSADMSSPSRAVAPLSPSGGRSSASGGRSSASGAKGLSSPPHLQVKAEAQSSPSKRCGDVSEALMAAEALMAELEGAGARIVDVSSEAPGISTSAICFICFDAEPNVTISGCNHRVCGTCAKAIVEKANLCKILACPFCRKPVRGFK